MDEHLGKEGQPTIGIGGVWKHTKSGGLYAVIGVPNYSSTREGFPCMVVYLNAEGEVFSRLATEWREKFTLVLDPKDRLPILKKAALHLRTLTETAAYAYFAACEVGEERIKAGTFYDNVRNAGRV